MNSSDPAPQVKLIEPSLFDAEKLAETEKLRSFLAAIFDPDDVILIRLIEAWTEQGKKKNRIVCSEYLDVSTLGSKDRWDQLLEAAERERANLFFGVCPRNRKLADKAHQIRTVRVLWADLDHVSVEDAQKRVRDARLPGPSIVIFSGHGVHLYWILREPFLIDDRTPDMDRPVKGKKPPLSPKAKRIESIIEALAALIGGDHTKDLPRLLRLPASLNRKNERHGALPIPCKVVECQATRRYPLAEFESQLGVEVPPAADTCVDKEDIIALFRPPTVAAQYADLPANLRDELDRLVRDCESPSDDDRSRADFACCCWAIRKGITKDIVGELLKNVGKTAERGASYFDATWAKAAAEVAKDQEQPPAPAPAAPPCPAGPAPALKEYPLGPVRVVPESPRRTPTGKVNVTLRVVNESDECVKRLPLSEACSNRKDAIQSLKRLAADIDPEPVIDRILVDAAAFLDRQNEAGRPGTTITDILAEKVPPRFGLVFRTDRGAYSEKRTGEVTVVDFCRFVPVWLRKECERASDCPSSRVSLLRMMKAELESLWASIVEKLPTEDQANVGPDSPAAKRFKGKLIEVLTFPTTFEVSRGSQGSPAGGNHAAKTNIIERIRDSAKNYLGGNKMPVARDTWQKVQKAYDCWWRVIKVRGKVVIVIGLRYRIGYQTLAMKSLPGVFDQESFRRQCERSGIAELNPKVRARLTDGSRLVVLSQRFVRELMAEPPSIKKDQSNGQETPFD